MKVLAIIPHYNHADTVGKVVAAMRGISLDCLLVDDGSHEMEKAVIHKLAEQEGVDAVFLPQNAGKGAAMKAGFAYAEQKKYSHALQVDADAQHCLEDAQKLLESSFRQPEAVICAEPVYGIDAPKSRLYGRKITNFWLVINTGSCALRDGMCGFRIYPLAATKTILDKQKIGNRMDFDIEILVWLFWQKNPIIWVKTPVDYPAVAKSHFRIWQDNWLISKMHARLFFRMIMRRLRIDRSS